MFRSISSQLQFSYGLLVLAALVGLGVFGFLQQKSEMLREVDEGLQRRSRQINAILVRHDLEGLGAPRRRENSEDIPTLPPLPGSAPGDLEAEIYDQVWKLEAGTLNLIFQSAEFPGQAAPVPYPREIGGGGITRMVDSQRQMLNRAVRDYVILVGADLSPREARLNQFLFRMILGEAAFFVLFLLLGSWLTRRALGPIREISKTARTISGGALDERIPVEAGSSELRDLSGVLNESFDHLEDSIMRQRQFTSDASHELRTPIAAILAEGQSKPQTLDEYCDSLGRCVEMARSMRRLVDQLLELARFDSGQSELRREATDLDLLVSRAMQQVRPIAEKKLIGIESDLKPVQAEVNPVRISQVVINLLNNAVAYTGEGGRIRVRLGETEGAIEIAVEDNGIGIAKEDLPNLFQRFYRADKSRSDHGQNHFGLGLAISREIAQAHGGSLRAESEPGKGSVFVLRLPRDETPPIGGW